MKCSIYILFVLCLLNLSSCEYIYVTNAKKSVYRNLTLSTPNSIIKTNLKGSSDVNINNVNVYKNTEGYKYFASGYVTISNSWNYNYLYCGFTEHEPETSDLRYFVKYSLDATSSYSRIELEIGYDHDAKYFSCFVCDSSVCYGMMKKFSSHSEIIDIVIVVIVVILICCCCFGCGCYGYSRNKARYNNNNLPVTNGIPVSNNVNVNPITPVNNQVVYAVQNPDGSIQYYSAAGVNCVTPSVQIPSTPIPSTGGCEVVMNNNTVQEIPMNNYISPQTQQNSSNEPTYMPPQLN